jgi:outer membrane protein
MINSSIHSPKASDIALLTLLVACSFIGYPVIGEEMSPEQKPVLASSATTGELSFEGFVKKLISQNQVVQAGRLQWGIATTSVENAESEFQPVFSATVRRDRSKTRNTVEEAFARSSLSEYEKIDDTYNMVLSKKIRTGATIQVSSTLESVRNSLQPRSLSNGERKSFVGVSINQPLLRNIGARSNLARIRVSESDRGIAYHRYREEVMQILSAGSSAYWNLLLKQEILAINEDSLRITQQLLEDLELRESVGRAKKTDVLDAQAGVAFRKALLAQSKRSRYLAENKLATLLSEGRWGKVNKIKASEMLTLEEFSSDRVRTIERALAVSPQYLVSLAQAKKENVRVVYAANKRLPELNLLASYGLNGLAPETDDSLDDLEERDHPTWAVGLQLKIAVGKDKKSRSEYAAASMRKQEALLNVKAAEVAAINAVDAAIREIETLREEYQQVEAVKEGNKKLFEIETESQRAGASTVRLVLEREMELNQAIRNALEVNISYQAAVTALRILDGTLLLEAGLKAMEPEYGRSTGLSTGLSSAMFETSGT